MTNSPFIIKLFETYNGSQTLYFLMEPAIGGELYNTYNRKGFHGSEKHARFYVAGVVFAFEHLHARHIIYRDLKPENLLMNETGHLKVTDMGLAKLTRLVAHQIISHQKSFNPVDTTMLLTGVQ